MLAEPVAVEAASAEAAKAPSAWGEEAHVQRLQELCAPRAPIPPLRRGAGQQQRRRREHETRRRLVEFCRWTDAHGWSQRATADLLGLAPRTLRLWQHCFAPARPRLDLGPAALGRPVLRSPRAVRQQVLEVLAELGAGVGVPTLRECFPALLRAELADLLGRYRRTLRRRSRASLAVLTWTTPATVWAVDFTEPPAPLEGAWPYLLAVRDLASGQQLLWQPVAAPTAAEVTNALALLFALCGAPLVLKSDNGPAFHADQTQALLAQAGVIPLFSPPYLPRYNGAIEAGIGSLTTRTERHAARHERPGQWTLDDAAAALAEANCLARPRGERGPSPDTAWAARPRLSAEQRHLFAEAVARQRDLERTREGLVTEGTPEAAPAARLERRAIQRALVEHGLLVFSRRRIPLPIPRRKAARHT